MSKIASHIKSILPSIKNNEIKEDSFVSNKLRAGIQALQNAPEGDYKVTITVTKVDKADGYEIYRSTKKTGKYTKVATLTSEEEILEYDLCPADIPLAEFVKEMK